MASKKAAAKTKVKVPAKKAPPATGKKAPAKPKVRGTVERASSATAKVSAKKASAPNRGKGQASLRLAVATRGTKQAEPETRAGRDAPARKPPPKGVSAPKAGKTRAAKSPVRGQAKPVKGKRRRAGKDDKNKSVVIPLPERAPRRNAKDARASEAARDALDARMDDSDARDGTRAPDGVSAGGIAEGDHAPSFMLQDDTGTVFSSETLRGSPYVLYFYPKDDTPGCTLQACGFRDSLPRFSAKGVRVIGVSPDLPATHARFKKKYGLSFPLLSDPEKTLAKAYGVWVKKQNYGREYMGVERSTFFVDRSGTITQVWRGVKVPGHVDMVLDAV